MSVTDGELRSELESEGHQNLVTYVSERAGPTLRCVVAYDVDGWHVLHGTEDVDRDEFARAVSGMKRWVRAAEHGPRPRIAVDGYEDVSVVHRLRDDRRSVARLLDAAATPEVRAFAERCHDRMER